jgi:DNA-binding transcriptional regulator YdaS (Cro superfamily)
MATNLHIERALSLLGGDSQKTFADEVGVTPAAVSHWLNCRRQVSPKHVRAIERVTNGRVTRHDLRPDIFGNNDA